MKNKSYIFVLILLFGVSILTYQLIVPQFSKQEYDKETVQNISEGITTTTEVRLNEAEETVDIETEEPLDAENDLNIDSIVEDELLKFNDAEKLEGIFTSYLLIGSDERTENSSAARGYVKGKRADVLILGLINNQTNQTSLVSIPRDLLIKNSCTEKVERINSSFSSNNCGNSVENLAAAILNLTGVTIEHLALFNFEGFEKIIDSVGGIELCLDNTIREGFSFELQKGCQVVSGEIALNWVVSRNTEVLVGNKVVDANGNDASTWRKLNNVSDLTRIQRQQDVVIELLSQVSSFGSLGELTNFISALEDTFTIDENLSNSKAATILWNLRNEKLAEINKLTIPTRPYKTESGMEVLILTSSFKDFLSSKGLLD
ncbi:MAG: LCP family protein [Actinomycetota bacterium]|nr:LCP family protein [Actinomycetota bacterium]